MFRSNSHRAGAMELTIFVGFRPADFRIVPREFPQYRRQFFFRAGMDLTGTGPFVLLGHRWPYFLLARGTMMEVVAQRVMVDNSTPYH